MKLFSQRHKETWHRQVDLAAKIQQLFVVESQGAVLNKDFPWATLQHYTNQYMARRGGSLTQQQRDARVLSLINGHAAKDVAIAACGHLMSVDAVRSLLVKIVPEQSTITSTSLQPFLRSFTVAGQVKEEAISNKEVQLAKELMVAPWKPVGQYVDTLFQMMGSDLAATSLLYPCIRALAPDASIALCALATAFRSQNNYWREAYPSFAFLSTYIADATPESTEVAQILAKTFPDWRGWANWRPNSCRIAKMRPLIDPPYNLTNLTPFLCLEGPDFLSSSFPNLRYAYLARELQPGATTLTIGDIVVELQEGSQNEAKTMIDRLMSVLEAVSSDRPADLSLFIYLCIDKPIKHKSLEILEAVVALGDNSISLMVNELYQSGDLQQIAKSIPAMRLLPILSVERCKDLRVALLDDFVPIITAALEFEQDLLRSKLLSNQPWAGTDVHIRTLGENLLRAGWLYLRLNEDIQELLKEWPTAQETLLVHSIRTTTESLQSEAKTSLLKMVDIYISDCLLKRRVVNMPTRKLIKELIEVWKLKNDTSTRSFSLTLASEERFPLEFRYQCLFHLKTSSPAFVQSLWAIVNTDTCEPDTAAVKFADLLASSTDDTSFWRQSLYKMLQERGTMLIDYALEHMNAAEWMQFFADLHFLFASEEAWDIGVSPAILKPSLQRWVQRLSACLSVITELESEAVFADVVKCLLLGGEGELGDSLGEIVEILIWDIQSHSSAAILGILSQLKRDGSNATQIHAALASLRVVSPVGADACLHILELYLSELGIGAKLVFEGYLEESATSEAYTKEDVIALKGISELLSLGDAGGWSDEILKIAANHLDTQYAALLAEAQRLESMRIALKGADPSGASELLANIRIEDPTPIEDALGGLPPELVNVVEKVGEQELEMLFPLTHLTQLQRNAMGVGTAQGLLVRLIIGDYGMPPGFCIHLDTELRGKSYHSMQNNFAVWENWVTWDMDDTFAESGSKGKDIEGASANRGIHTIWEEEKSNHDSSMHCPWICFSGGNYPDSLICFGEVCPAKYQLARILSRHLMQGFSSVHDIYTLISNVLKAVGNACITCGNSHGVNLRGSTTCGTSSCLYVFQKSNLEVRLSPILHDPGAVDLLLTMVHSAANSGNLSLLPGCPFSSPSDILDLLSGMPPVGCLSQSGNLSAYIQSFGPGAETIFNWVCTSHRGFLASATGPLKIPNLPPGTQQFVLANTAPEFERAFARHVSSHTPTRVLFHGTSPDRLFSILNQGLKILSNTPLQVHGAASGAGIYMAEEPSLSWTYANRNRGRATNWPGSTFHDFNILLGCEYVGHGTAVNGMHVLKDESTVLVRYVFLIPSNANRIPIRGHLVPAMESVCRSLRSGAL